MQDVGGSSSLYFLPMARSAPIALRHPTFPVPVPDPNSSEALQQPDPCQSRADLNDFMKDDLRSLAQEDPFVFALDLLETSALSWIRFFSFLRGFQGNIEGDEEYQAEISRQDRDILYRAQTDFDRVIAILDDCHLLGWPQCQNEADRRKIDKAVQSVRNDFSSLQDNAKCLMGSIENIRSARMVSLKFQTVKQKEEQAVQIKKLKTLVCLYLPAIFICNVFRTNVTTFKSTSLTAFLATLIPFTIFFMTVLLWEELEAGVKELKVRIRARCTRVRDWYWDLVYL